MPFSKTEGIEGGLENGNKPAGDWRAALNEAYWDGLSTTVTQEYRLSKQNVGIGTRADFKDYDFIQDMVTSYTFDFYRTLRICERLNVAPGTALHLAKLAYKFNPNILISLTQKYPDMDAYIITRAAVSYPSNPDAFLDGVIEADFGEYVEFWIALSADESLKTKALRAGYISIKELEALQQFFEGKGNKPPRNLLDKLTIAVANLA